MKKLILFALLWHFAPLLWAQFGGGNGTTSETAFEISSVEHLATLATNVNNGTTYEGSFFKQMNNINLNVDPYNTGVGWIPIGTLIIDGEVISEESKPFKGNYNGQGYAIQNLFVNASDAGLFGYLSNAVISNLHLSSANVTGVGIAGALTSWLIGSTVTNCSSSGTISSAGNTGGLLGLAATNCTIEYCSSSCVVISSSDYAGGLVGELWDNNNMNYCYATGAVTGTNKVGGLSGANETSSTITNCYATGNVSATQTEGKVGGLLGQSDQSTVINCFSTGAVNGPEGALIGGLIGFSNASTISNSFWDISTSGQSTSAGGAGRTTALMKTLFTFMRSAWDFKGEAGNGSNEIWNIGNSRNDGYPYLSWQYPSDDGIVSGTVTAPATGDGSPGNPYQIATLENLNWITENTSRWGYHYMQTSNIDASSTSTWNNGEGWMPIGNPVNFTGSYNGQGFTIDGLYINKPANSYMGLFGVLENATVSSLGMTNVSITGRSVLGALGGLHGFSTITNCYSTGTVSGSLNYIGGLYGTIGASSGITIAENCYSECVVSGASFVGGLAGLVRNSTVDLSNATGVVTGTGNFVGGLAGQNYVSTIKRTFATGAVSGVSYVGGLAGQNFTNAVIEDCYATGYTSGTENEIGGLTGANLENSSITRSFATGNVSGPVGVGGLLGANSPNSVITNSYSKGNVVRSTGSSIMIASFVGQCYGTVSNCYATGSVTYNGEATQPTNKGFAGFAEGNFTANFFDQTTSGQTSGEWAAAKTTAEMKTQSTYTDAGWDFVGESGNGSNDYWQMIHPDKGSYPFFSWQLNTWNGTGVWSTTANWSKNALPREGDYINVSTGTLTLNQNSKIAGMTVGAQSALIVNNDVTSFSYNELYLKSDASGTAKLLCNLPDKQGSMEQFVKKDQWHYFGLPVSGDHNVVDLFKGFYVSSCNEALATHNSADGWNFLEHGNTVSSSRGFGIYHKDIDTTFSVFGTLNTDNKVINVTYSGVNFGWNLISNPYPCTVDWDQLKISGLSNVNDAIYVYDPATDNYATYIGGATGGAETQTNYIAPMQGFFVRSTANGSVTFSNASKTIESSSFKSAGIETIIRLTAFDAEGRKDGAVIRIHPSSTDHFDGELDAYKLKLVNSITPQFYSVLNGVEYSINSVPELTQKTVIPFELMIKSSGQQRLSLAELTGYGYDYPIILLNGSGEELAKLKNEDYTFEAKAGETITLFLTFADAVSVNELLQRNVFVSSMNQNILVGHMGNIPSEVSVYNLSGQMIYNNKVETNELLIPVSKQGAYVVRVQPEKGSAFIEKVVIK